MDELWRSVPTAVAANIDALAKHHKLYEQHAFDKHGDASCSDDGALLSTLHAVASLEQPTGVAAVAVSSSSGSSGAVNVVAVAATLTATAPSEPLLIVSDTIDKLSVEPAAATTTVLRKRSHDDADDNNIATTTLEHVEPVVWHLSHRPQTNKPRRKLTELDPIAQIGFGGCGGMYNYFLGVASVLQEEYDLTDVIFSGVSAGCFPAMVLALQMDVKEFFFKENLPLIEHAAACSFVGLRKWIPLVRASTLAMLPHDAYQQVDRRLYFSVTEVPSLRNHVLTTWTSNADMVDCMLCSGHVPLYTETFVASYRGKRFVDGGLSNNFPILQPTKPHKMLQIWKWRWLNPTWLLVTTNAEWAMELFRMGREDATKHLAAEIDAAFFPKTVTEEPSSLKRMRVE